MSVFGLLLLPLVGLLLITTGLPAYLVLLLAAVVGACVAVMTGHVPVATLGALPVRLINLLESDLLQALPLYVLMGVMLRRLAVASAMFKLLAAMVPGRGAGALTATIGLGALLGPMNGSVGASVLALSRAVGPALVAARIPTAAQQATIAAAGTLGVVIPPSLVLILLGDAMLSAHTIAVNTTGRTDRIINTHDVFRGALVPAAIILLLAIAVAAWTGWRNGASQALGGTAPADATAAPLSRSDVLVAAISIAMLIGLLGAVAFGFVYAVEAAAAGAFAMFAYGALSGAIRQPALGDMLTESLIGTGVLFAPLLAATSFTLVLRLLGTDKLIEAWVVGLPASAVVAVAIILLCLALSAFVLDAFEIIFVMVPIVIPALLIRVPDATWVAVLVLLTLQASFLLPPIGYALMMARSTVPGHTSNAEVTRALAPFLLAQAGVLALVLAVPALVHTLDEPGSGKRAPAVSTIPKEELDRRIRDQMPPAGGGLPGLTLPPFQMQPSRP